MVLVAMMSTIRPVKIFNLARGEGISRITNGQTR
jgi:hypothetical protein